MKRRPDGYETRTQNMSMCPASMQKKMWETLILFSEFVEGKIRVSYILIVLCCCFICVFIFFSVYSFLLHKKEMQQEKESEQGQKNTQTCW